MLEPDYDIDPRGSWLLAASEKNLPIYVPGWEDSTLGNMFTAAAMQKKLGGFGCMKFGAEQMAMLIDWYRETDKNHRLGFFQIGGGISGDYPICVVPLIRQDMKQDVRTWGYFCQISEAKTSYGSYSGAPPSEM